MRKIFVYFIISLLLVGLVPAKMEAAITEPQMKIELSGYVNNKTSVSLKLTGSYKVEKENGDTILLNKDTNYTVKVEGLVVHLYEGTTMLESASQITINPINDRDKAVINGRSYFGGFIFKKNNAGYLVPTNLIGMEEYLKSVVPSEMIASEWHEEAFKAQAVAARTYAYFKHLKGETLTDTTGNQAYKGADVVHPNTTKAVEATTGEMMTYQGKVFEAQFSASNGGMTESSKNETGWQHDYHTVKEDTFDTRITWDTTIYKQQVDTTGLDLSQPDQWWNTTIERDIREKTDDKNTFTENIKAHLQTHGYPNKDIKIVSIPKLEFRDKTSSGRAIWGALTVQFFVKDEFEDGKLKLQTYIMKDDKWNDVLKVTASDVKRLIGSHDMTSTLITESTVNDELYSFKGMGNGHGVGLSQHGANNRAIEGRQSYKDILFFYYDTGLAEKIKLEKIYQPTYKSVKVQLNGKDFTPGYYGVSTTFVHWKALNTFKIPFTFKDGEFNINGRKFRGETINGGLYIRWTDIAPGKVTFKSISGGFNFMYSVPVPIKIQLNGNDFTAGYFKDGAAYIHWKALETFKIPFTWKGNESFVINGQPVQGEYINGPLYIRWNLIAPGKIIFKQIPGGYNFIYTP
ncbi:SpoIID/LytB domain-containing protein [Neobacillus sp. CF12]|uniref:SpoIID/LytB domain-containing protein n=1 Tax=Neobacillus sp. CF12 TaxID=3055864 RepID=UPI0025A278E2|nr:SpoIID/LytB domain-containing protein [Neobacillus sp. CF12]MDM5329810.1 SpoIID/LytB domain-containing protein [Neobacillus sp. CF12]